MVTAMDAVGAWQAIWAGFAIVLLLCELFTPAALFFAPFAMGGAAAIVALAAGKSPSAAAVTFGLVSAGLFLLLWPLGRRFDRGRPDLLAFGADRFTGRTAKVGATIEVGGSGLIRFGREEWRAKSLTDARISPGTSVMIVWMTGTTAVVVPSSPSSGFSPPTRQRRRFARAKE